MYYYRMYCEKQLHTYSSSWCYVLYVYRCGHREYPSESSTRKGIDVERQSSCLYVASDKDAFFRRSQSSGPKYSKQGVKSLLGLLLIVALSTHVVDPICLTFLFVGLCSNPPADLPRPYHARRLKRWQSAPVCSEESSWVARCVVRGEAH